MLDWTVKDTWVAVFDVLGFRELVRQADSELPRQILTSKIDDLLEEFDSDIVNQGGLDFLVFSDTIAVFTPDLTPQSYPWFLLQCRKLIETSIKIRLPLRGAISVGTAVTCKAPPIVLGSAFLEAHEYCEDQDWIGLLLTPSATRLLREANLEPTHHDFVEGAIPLRKMPREDVLAYRFQNGEANFDSWLLSFLAEMKQRAPAGAKDKYTRTIAFIQKHYRYIDSSSRSPGAIA